MAIAIAYHEDYSKYNLGEAHPFLSLKPRKTIEFLRAKNLMGSKLKLLVPVPVGEEDLARVHTRDFIELVKKLSEKGGMLALDTPAPKGIFEIAKLACGGTKLMAEEVAQEKFWCGINTLGGFHHAGKDSASGFCFFNDLAIAIEYLRSEYKIKKFMVVDTDVHHANGTQEIYYDDNSVLLISLHQDGRTLYPGTGFTKEIGVGKGKGYTTNIPLLPATAGKAYLYAFDTLVPKLANQFQPEIIFWQSGVDTYWQDPLANLNLTLDTYYSLGLRMKAIAESTCNKLVVCLGGGYHEDGCVKGYYNEISGLLKADNFINEKKVVDERRINETKEIIDRAIMKLSNYWNF
ncbi:MAG: histone deacetylase family protein [Candidatus Thermoplasmatota archaeon]|nr:histone deacetylase family protein [Candidatus Thermoplasmatota archaeon]